MSYLFFILNFFLINLLFSASLQLSVSGLPFDGYLTISDISGNFGSIEVNGNSIYTMPKVYTDNKNHAYSLSIKKKGFYNTEAPINRIYANSWGMNDGSAYIFGGSVNYINYLADLWYWNKNTKHFTRILPNYDCTIVNNNGSLFINDVILKINCISDLWPSPRTSSTTWKDSNNNLYMYGGDYTSFWNYFTNDLWKWDGSKWTYIVTPTSITARGLGQIWYVNDNEVYLFSGLMYDWPLIGDFWKWDGTNWLAVNPSHSYLPTGRFSAVTWKDNNSSNLYMYGGWSPWNSPVRRSDLWIYNIQNNSFSQTITVPNGPEMSYLNQKILDNCLKPYFYILGSNGTANILTWDYNTNGWINFATNVLSSIWIGGSAWCDSQGNLYLFDGQSYYGSAQNSLYEFNVDSNSWNNLLSY